MKKSKIVSSSLLRDIPESLKHALTNKELKAKQLQELRDQIRPEVLSIYR